MYCSRHATHSGVHLDASLLFDPVSVEGNICKVTWHALDASFHFRYRTKACNAYQRVPSFPIPNS